MSTDLTTTLVVPEPIVTTLVVGQGPAGIGASPAVLVAAEGLSAGSYVYIAPDGVRKADNRYQSRAAMGWINAGAAQGAAVTVQFAGINRINAGLTVGPVWLGQNGQLTQTPPTAAALVQPLGFATSATDVNFLLGMVVVLAGTQP
jgi:hypothetical protein